MSGKQKSAYAKAGVDIDKADRFVGAISKMVKATLNEKVHKSVGGYASLYKLSDDQFIAATTDDWHEVASRYADEAVRFPILADVAVKRRLTAIIDPRGVVRHVGLRSSARETLASLEALLIPLAQAA